MAQQQAGQQQQQQGLEGSNGGEPAPSETPGEA
jgi:hypothetical protein